MTINETLDRLDRRFGPMRREGDDGELEIERQEPVEHDEFDIGGEG